MELLNDLFVPATLALVLSFLVAKLLSLATAACPGRRDSDELITVEDVRSEQQLRVQSTRSQRKAEFLVREPLEMVDEISPIQVENNLEIERNCGEIAVNSDAVGKIDGFQVDRHLDTERNREEVTVESDVIENAEEFQIERNSGSEHIRGDVTFDSDVVESSVVSSEEKSSEDTGSEMSKIVQLVQETTTEVDVYGESRRFVCAANLDDSFEQSNKERVEEINKESTLEKGISAQPEEITDVKSDKKERDEEREVMEDFEDDWEGIERSELEKVFMAATEFVVGNGSDSVASTGSDVQMELYGLHKVATEGPCREPQPMPLKLSARAKWNAWQKLGNMSPEVAMEQYVTLLSDKVPGWVQGTSAGISEQEPTRSALSDAAATDLDTSLSHQQNIINERTLEQESGSQDNIPKESDLANHQKED